MKLSLGEIAAAVQGRIARGAHDLGVDGFTNDSRSSGAGMGFVALLGDRDGHDFVDRALLDGCVAALVSRPNMEVDGALVEVADTLGALALLAKYARVTHLDRARVVGITGSVGKTSTKDFMVAAMGPLGAGQVHANAESFNNEIGLPLTVLSAPRTTRALLLEMGARFEGNIRDLCDIAKPNIGVVTNIGLAHAEHLGGRDGVLRVKGELIAALPPDGLGILPDGSDAVALAARTSARCLRVGTQRTADVCATVVSLDNDVRAVVEINSPWGTATVKLGLRGAHQVVNAAMSVAAAVGCGVAFSDAVGELINAQGSKWRMDFIQLRNGMKIINDTYNANPASVFAAIDALVATQGAGRKIAVLGAMLELGDAAFASHQSVGKYCADRDVDVLLAVGSEGSWIADAAEGLATVDRVPTSADAIEYLVRACQPDDVVLVKASRAVGLERVVAALTEADGA